MQNCVDCQHSVIRINQLFEANRKMAKEVEWILLDIRNLKNMIYQLEVESKARNLHDQR